MEQLETRDLFAVALESAFSLGADSAVNVFDIAVDNAGNQYMTGSFSGTVDFDSSAIHAGDVDTLLARGEGDVFVVKYAPDDSLAWVRRMGGDFINPGAYTDTGRSISVTPGGSVFVTGDFYGSADFGASTLVSSGTHSGFLTKISAGGGVEWSKSFGETKNATERVSTDNVGNAYVLTVAKDLKAYNLMKFGSSGQTVWTNKIVTANAPRGDIAVSGAGDVYAVGSFWGTTDFDPSSKVKNVSASSTQQSSFVLKLDANGKFAWVAPFQGNGGVYAVAVTLDSNENVIVGGNYSGSIDFNPSSAVSKLIGEGNFVTKLNRSGQFNWATRIDDGIWSLDTDLAGNVYSTGSIATVSGDTDIAVSKLSSSGSLVWSESFGGSGNDIGWGIAVDSANNIYVAGGFVDVADFDPDPNNSYNLGTAGGSRKGFRLKLRQV